MLSSTLPICTYDSSAHYPYYWNQDLYATCPSLRHPTTIKDRVKQSTALSPWHLQTSTGMLSGPSAFLCFILFIAALSFLLSNPLHFLIHQLTSVLSHFLNWWASPSWTHSLHYISITILTHPNLLHIFSNSISPNTLLPVSLTTTAVLSQSTSNTSYHLYQLNLEHCQHCTSFFLLQLPPPKPVPWLHSLPVDHAQSHTTNYHLMLASYIAPWHLSLI